MSEKSSDHNVAEENESSTTFFEDVLMEFVRRETDV